MTDLTQTLDAWDAVCAKATRGPWRPSGYKGYLTSAHASYKIAQLRGSAEQPGVIAREDDKVEADCDFIALARTALPAAIRGLRKACAALTVIAAFNEGPVVTGSFDSPANAKVARAAIENIAAILKEGTP